MDVQKDANIIDGRIDNLHSQTRMLLEKMKILSSPVAIQYIEEDLVKNEEEITKLEQARADKLITKEVVNARTVVAYVKYYMEHLNELLIDLCYSINKASYFSVLFDKAPTYQEIKDGALKTNRLPEINELFKTLNHGRELLAGARGIEPRS